MADTPRIEDLRSRYHGNPRRFFAPLANELRKSGMLDEALLLCEQQEGDPSGNLNGLVIHGRILFEMKRYAAARVPFAQALKLDPENLIALRHLGDIARVLGDKAEAKGWYTRLLELDRHNKELRELLAQSSGPVPEPVARAPITRPTFVTETMAKLYVQQGLLAEAIAVYRHLVQASPDDAALKSRLTELESMHAQAAAPASAFDAMPDFPDFPDPSDITESSPVAANAALDAVSFGDIGLRGQGGMTPLVMPLAEDGPTARDFFRRFARRAALVATELTS
jgi:tetratricopeptide (TPR) repeat protein